jgi:hypothetical protein
MLTSVLQRRWVSALLAGGVFLVVLWNFSHPEPLRSLIVLAVWLAILIILRLRTPSWRQFALCPELLPSLLFLAHAIIRVATRYTSPEIADVLAWVQEPLFIAALILVVWQPKLDYRRWRRLASPGSAERST